MDDQFDVSLEDDDLLNEVELTANLMVAANKAERHLTKAEIDEVLGISSRFPPPRPGTEQPAPARTA
jgi:hypothetical protein